MAAGHPMNPWSAHTDQIERFAALVAEEVRGRTIESEKAGWLYALDKVVKEEREACAQVCEEVDDRLTEFHALDCAVAIRARGEK